MRFGLYPGVVAVVLALSASPAAAVAGGGRVQVIDVVIYVVFTIVFVGGLVSWWVRRGSGESE